MFDSKFIYFNLLFIVVNTQSSTGDEIGHWQMIYIGNKDDVVFFCSLGLEPLPPIQLYLSKNSKSVEKTKIQLQSTLSVNCGVYACVFLYFISHLKVSFSNVLQLFSSNQILNDQLINKMFHRISDYEN